MKPQRIGVGYDPRLDRFDVAIRAVTRACRQGKRSMLREMGVSSQEMSETQEALATLNHSFRSEAGVFELLERCPFLLDHALMLLIRYQVRCQEGL